MYLEGKRLYLSGPIEHGTNHNWRDAPKKALTERFKFNLFDPFADPKQQWVSSINEAKANKDYNKIVKIARSFVKKDLALVDRSDVLVAYFPYKQATYGTCHELINSINAKKPTLLVTDKEDISFLPLWFFGFIPLEFMFAGWDSLYEYFDKVNRGECRDNDKWSFVYGDI